MNNRDLNSSAGPNSFAPHGVCFDTQGFSKVIAKALLVATFLVGGDLSAQTLAFPGAEGAGKYVTGGRGTIGTATTVFEVTSLADNNVAGTLRWACSQSATYRTIVFRVSGTIHLNSELRIPGNTTIAGQTAPGDGICLADYWVILNANNIIIRHLRFRMGDKNQLITNSSDTNCQPIFPPFTATCKPLADVSGSYDSLGASYKSDFMIDHCSVSWCNDEALSLKLCDNTTVQWCIISEPLDYSYHYEGVETDFQHHAYGGIFGGFHSSLHHNIYAHCKSRTPRFAASSTDKTRVDFRNNVIYNWQINTAYGGEGGEFNIVSNYYKAGPNTTTDHRIVGTEPDAKYYMIGNKMVGKDGANGATSVSVTLNNWLGASSGAGSQAALELPAPILTNVALTTQHTADETYTIVLAQAGASIPKRDPIDTRIVNEIQTKTGGIIDVQGGYPHGTPYSISSNAWPVLLSTAAPTDSDHDGMPDTWETANGLNPGSAADRNNRNAEGYTMLEVYLNSIGSVAAPPPAPANLVATAGDQSVSLTWSAAPTATNYNVKRSAISGGSYSNLASIVATTYTDTQVSNGTNYYYVVSAINAVGESTNSPQASATPQTNSSPGGSWSVFNDTFSASTLNSMSPMSPTPTATSYELISTKTWSPTPGIANGHLKFGIASTTSGYIEVQALFTNSPINLANVGDRIALIVTFTNTSGLLMQAGSLGFGLYNSGLNYPVASGLNGTAVVGSTDHASGNAQSWGGYAAQLAFTGGTSQIQTRSPQTGSGNNNQDVLTTGSGSSYLNPPAATVGTASTAPSVTLVVGNPYTALLSLTLTAPNTLAITNSLYAGTNTNGLLLSQFGGVAAGGTYLTSSFDALAIGWRATANTYATTIDLNQISVNASFATPVSLNPTNLVYQIVGNQLALSWPATHLGWRLQAQTNALTTGLALSPSDWFDWPGSESVTQQVITIIPANPTVFFRLRKP